MAWAESTTWALASDLAELTGRRGHYAGSNILGAVTGKHADMRGSAVTIDKAARLVLAFILACGLPKDAVAEALARYASLPPLQQVETGNFKKAKLARFGGAASLEELVRHLLQNVESIGRVKYFTFDLIDPYVMLVLSSDQIVLFGEIDRIEMENVDEVKKCIMVYPGTLYAFASLVTKHSQGQEP